jgi:hypothetical protein
MPRFEKPLEFCPNDICENERLVKIGSAVGALVCPNCDLVVLYSPKAVDVYVPPTEAA